MGNLDGNVCFRKTRYGCTSGTLNTLCQYTLHDKQISCPLTIDLNIEKAAVTSFHTSKHLQKSLERKPSQVGNMDMGKLTRSLMGWSDWQGLIWVDQSDKVSHQKTIAEQHSAVFHCLHAELNKDG